MMQLALSFLLLSTSMAIIVGKILDDGAED